MSTKKYQKCRRILDCFIAGFSHSDGISVIDQLEIGVPVTLFAEPDNPYDPDAVLIYFDDVKLGYIPKGENSLFSNLLYFGHGDILEARISAKDTTAHPEKQFRIAISYRDNRPSAET